MTVLRGSVSLLTVRLTTRVSSESLGQSVDVRPHPGLTLQTLLCSPLFLLVLQASSLQYEMLLLTDSISKEDSCWELRLRCGEFRGCLVGGRPARGMQLYAGPVRPGSCPRVVTQRLARHVCDCASALPSSPSAQPFPHGREHQDPRGG